MTLFSVFEVCELGSHPMWKSRDQDRTLIVLCTECQVLQLIPKTLSVPFFFLSSHQQYNKLTCHPNGKILAWRLHLENEYALAMPLRPSRPIPSYP